MQYLFNYIHLKIIKNVSFIKAVPSEVRCTICYLHQGTGIWLSLNISAFNSNISYFCKHVEQNASLIYHLNSNNSVHSMVRGLNSDTGGLTMFSQ